MIRPATPDDTQAIVDLTVDAELFTTEEAVIVTQMLADHFGPKAGDGQVCVVDDVENRLVALAYYEPHVATDRTWELVMIGVHREQHRRGRGAALLHHVEDDLRSREQRLLLVETSALPAFDRARAFYRARGYDEEARVRDYFQDGDDMVLFRKKLHP
ncbi:MAG TPA: GNAT family N-acetyltransferase [Pseudonocardia sp.]